MTDILTMLAAPALAFAGGYLGFLVGRFGRAVYERWGWPGVAALVAGPLAALVGLTARRRPRPAPDTREEDALRAATRSEVDTASSDYREATMDRAVLEERMEALHGAATVSEVEARRAAREAEIRARGGR